MSVDESNALENGGEAVLFEGVFPFVKQKLFVSELLFDGAPNADLDRVVCAESLALAVLGTGITVIFGMNSHGGPFYLPLMIPSKRGLNRTYQGRFR